MRVQFIQANDLFSWDIEFTFLDLNNQIVWSASINGTANRVCSSEDLTDGSGKITGTRSWSHGTGDVDNVVHGDVTIVLD